MKVKEESRMREKLAPAGYRGWVTFGVLALGLAFAASPALADGSNLQAPTSGAAETPAAPSAKPKKFQKLVASGQGLGTFTFGEDCATAEGVAALTCPSGHTCHCVNVTGPISAVGLGTGTITFNANFDLSSAENNTVTFTNGVGTGLCLPGSGLGTIAGKSSSVTFSYVGIECDNTNAGLSDQLTGFGTIFFQGGAGKLTAASGVGTLNFAFPFGSAQTAVYSASGSFSKK
jgi:hypothetical protein